MASERPYEIPRAPEQVVTDDGVPTRAFYRWMSQVNLLVGQFGVLGQLEDLAGGLDGQVVQNTVDIGSNVIDIGSNTGDITTLSGQISALTASLTTLTTAFNNHVLATIAHGANGDVVGNLDLAQLLPGDAGVVNQAIDPLDSIAVTIAGLVTDYNTLLAELRTAGIIG